MKKRRKNSSAEVFQYYFIAKSNQSMQSPSYFSMGG